MGMKLEQKRLLKGARIFEISDEAVYVQKKGLFKSEKLAVSLSMLNPEPVVHGDELEFHDRADHGALISLYQDKPDKATFDAFVHALQQGILASGTNAAGDESVSALQPGAPGWNVYEEPPEFEENDAGSHFKPVNAERLADDIAMLKLYLDEQEIKSLLDTLESLKADPGNEAAFQKMLEAFNRLNIQQGAVLTYAPYLKILLSYTIWT